MAKIRHNHTIIQQVIPNTSGHTAVFASWEPPYRYETLKVECVAIPAFALVTDCQKQDDNEPYPCLPDLQFQRLEPMVEGEFGEFVNISDPGVEAINWKFLGTDTKNGPEYDWMIKARDAFKRAKEREEERVAAKNKKGEPAVSRNG